MKIGFDAKRAFHNNTGLGNYSRDLIEGMANLYSENEYKLFTPKTSSNPRIDFVKSHDNLEVITPTTFTHNKLKSYWRTFGLEKDLLKNNIEIYHGLSQEIPKRKKDSTVKYVVTIHDLIFLRHPETYKFIDRKIYDKKFRYASENADLIIAISEQTKQDLIDFYKIDPLKIRVVYQSCHNQFKQKISAENVKSIQAKHKLPSTYLLYVGTIEQRKNLKSLIEAAKNIDIPIVAVGRKTDYFQEISKAVIENEMEDRVTFLENVPFHELPAIYQGASLFCYPSVFEGFGIPIIEAMYSNIPVITSKGGVFPETGGPLTSYIDPMNTNEIAEEIKSILNDSDKREKMIIEGNKFVQKFSTENFINDTYKVYEELIK